MDSLTHIVAGAAIGEALLGKKIGKKAMLWGAIAGSAPDIDAVTNFFVSDVDSLLLHRGITHSIFTALIFGPLIGWLLWKHYKKREGMAFDWVLLITVNILFHLFLDTCTVYGTGLFTPFSNYRYAFDNIFVADPLYTLPLLIAFVALLILKRDRPSRKTWNLFGLGLSSAYLVFTFVNHSNAINALERSVEEKGIHSNGYLATPTLLNNILWSVIAKDSTGYWFGYYSIFDTDPTPDLFYVTRNDKLLDQLDNQEDIQKLKQFAMGYYSVTQIDGATRLNILRFGQVSGWRDSLSMFALSYDLTPGTDNSLVVQTGRVEGAKREVLKSMLERMKGK